MNLLSGLISTLIPLAPLFQKAEAKEKGDDSIYGPTPFQRWVCVEMTSVNRQLPLYYIRNLTPVAVVVEDIATREEEESSPLWVLIPVSLLVGEAGNGTSNPISQVGVISYLAESGKGQS